VCWNVLISTISITPLTSSATALFQFPSIFNSLLSPPPPVIFHWYSCAPVNVNVNSVKHNNAKRNPSDSILNYRVFAALLLLGLLTRPRHAFIYLFVLLSSHHICYSFTVTINREIGLDRIDSSRPPSLVVTSHPIHYVACSLQLQLRFLLLWSAQRQSVNSNTHTHTHINFNIQTMSAAMHLTSRPFHSLSPSLPHAPLD
jgi:hypothetical protein